MNTGYLSYYRGRRVMVTGGLGFIGSNLVHQLAAAGADILVVDSLLPDYGGNLFNIEGVRDRVQINVSDVRDETSMVSRPGSRDHLQSRRLNIDSMRDPHTDFEINCRAQLTMLEACRKRNPHVRVVYAGTRQVYGRPDRLPVDEQHLVRPADINGVNKAAGEYYHLLYNNVFGIRACSLRLTNVYGPRQLIRHSRQGFIGWFIRLAIEGQEIQIFGDGSQLRDFVYVDDAADAFLRAGATDASNGEVFNVGGDEPISHRELVAMLIDVAGAGSMRFVEWPPEKKRIDIGSFYSDSTKFRKTVGWTPRVGLRDGLQRTLAYYRQHLAHYVDEVSEPAQGIAT